MNKVYSDVHSWSLSQYHLESKWAITFNLPQPFPQEKNQQNNSPPRDFKLFCTIPGGEGCAERIDPWISLAAQPAMSTNLYCPAPLNNSVSTIFIAATSHIAFINRCPSVQFYSTGSIIGKFTTWVLGTLACLCTTRLAVASDQICRVWV